MTQCISDELYWVDYDTSLEYNWESLQSNSDYSLETETEIILFNFGQNVEKTCQGQKASALSFSKTEDSCVILGRHEISYLTPFKTKDTSGLVLFYEGGSICKNRYFNNFKHRIEFKLTCSASESEFFLSSDPGQCTTILEKKGKSGCSKEYQTSFATKIVLFS
jgi:hypothetical protein